MTFVKFAARSARIAGRNLILLSCGLVSIFLLASGYESVFNKPFPLVSTIQAVDLSAFSANYNLAQAAKYTPAAFGTFGRPVTLKLPSGGVRLNIVSPIVDGDVFLARALTLHMLIPKPPRSGNIGATFLYCRSSFRTITNANLPQVGQNIFIDTDSGWRYVYKVTVAGVYPDTRPVVSADDSQSSTLMVDCHDSSAHTNLVVTGTLLSVQGISQ